jgi:hypothetical protein
MVSDLQSSEAFADRGIYHVSQYTPSDYTTTITPICSRCQDQSSVLLNSRPLRTVNTIGICL